MTETCTICGGMYFEERYCPNCYGRYIAGKLPFKEIPPELEEFYDEGVGRQIDLDYETEWAPCEILRRQLYAKLNSPEARKGTPAEQATFIERATKEALQKRQPIIMRAAARLRGQRRDFATTCNNLVQLEDFQF